MKHAAIIDFGDYVTIEQKRYGVPNEMYLHKVIGVLESNAWVDVPVNISPTESLHEESEPVVACVLCGINERQIYRYRLKDVQPAGTVRKPTSAINMIGERYHRLVVTAFLSSDRRGSRWTCLCDCGTWCAASRDALVSGGKKSCGCLKRELEPKLGRKKKRRMKPTPVRTAPVDTSWFSTLPVAGCVSLR